MIMPRALADEVGPEIREPIQAKSDRFRVSFPELLRGIVAYVASRPPAERLSILRAAYPGAGDAELLAELARLDHWLRD
jgi:hypothetical protein